MELFKTILLMIVMGILGLIALAILMGILSIPIWGTIYFIHLLF